MITWSNAAPPEPKGPALPIRRTPAREERDGAPVIQSDILVLRDRLAQIDQLVGDLQHAGKLSEETFTLLCDAIHGLSPESVTGEEGRVEA